MFDVFFKKRGGYITLLSVLIVGAVGLSIGVSLLWLGAGSLRTAFTVQQANLAKAYANECGEAALFNIAANANYAGSDSINFSHGSCTYTVVHASQSETVNATGTAGTIVRKIEITLDTSGFLWQEIP